MARKRATTRPAHSLRNASWRFCLLRLVEIAGSTTSLARRWRRRTAAKVARNTRTARQPRHRLWILTHAWWRQSCRIRHADWMRVAAASIFRSSLAASTPSRSTPKRRPSVPARNTASIQGPCAAARQRLSSAAAAISARRASETQTFRATCACTLACLLSAALRSRSSRASALFASSCRMLSGDTWPARAMFLLTKACPSCFSHLCRAARLSSCVFSTGNSANRISFSCRAVGGMPSAVGRRCIGTWRVGRACCGCGCRSSDERWREVVLCRPWLISTHDRTPSSSSSALSAHELRARAANNPLGCLRPRRQNTSPTASGRRLPLDCLCRERLGGRSCSAIKHAVDPSLAARDGARAAEQPDGRPPSRPLP
mmetsp:Transcript_33191/g.86081  ORF Transcript_33191/g.86081 Transcript_33191/m.86081 type:complete len:372 (-) Transcript_33191:379-1494(-)